MKLRNNNINVRMISGDNLETAKAAALAAGIVTDNEVNNENVCMTGDQIIELLGGDYPKKVVVNGIEREYYSIAKKDVIEAKINKCMVVGRCNSEQKYAFINALQSRGESSVAVTGRSITDAMALKEAKVSFCMGTGT